MWDGTQSSTRGKYLTLNSLVCFGFSCHIWFCSCSWIWILSQLGGNSVWFHIIRQLIWFGRSQICLVCYGQLFWLCLAQKSNVFDGAELLVVVVVVGATKSKTENDRAWASIVLSQTSIHPFLTKFSQLLPGLDSSWWYCYLFANCETKHYCHYQQNRTPFEWLRELVRIFKLYFSFQGVQVTIHHHHESASIAMVIL